MRQIHTAHQIKNLNHNIKLQDLFALEISHHNTPVSVREQVRIAPNYIEDKLLELKQKTEECYILSTCNRLLIIAVSTNSNELTDFMATLGPYKLYFRHFYGAESVARHLFAVTSGLCSQLIGEEAIVKQVRDAYQRAKDTDTLGPHLHKLLDRALVASKQIRTQTALGREPQTYADIIWALICRSFHETCGKRALLVGTGDVAQRLLPKIIDNGLAIKVLSRSQERLSSLQAKYSCIETGATEQLPSLASLHDIVIGATDTQTYIIHNEQYSELQKRQLWIDLGLPRNFDPRLGQRDRLMLYDIDSLKSRLQDTDFALSHQMQEASELIEYHVANYLERYARLAKSIVLN